MRKFIKRLSIRALAAVSGSFDIDALMRLSKVSLLSVYYHLVSNDPDVIHVKHLYRYKSEKEFQTDIDTLLTDFQPISLDDLLLNLHYQKPLRRNSLLMTFDDGLSQMHDIVAPILKKKGIPALFFISSAFVDNKELFFRFKASILIDKCRRLSSKNRLNEISRILGHKVRAEVEIEAALKSITYLDKHILDALAAVLEINYSDYLERVKPYMSCEQVGDLINDGFHIGAHSVDHPPYSMLSLTEQLEQTYTSMMFLMDRFCTGHKVFAFPFSQWGVTWEFYKSLSEHGDIDVIFGTGGLGYDSTKKLLSRVSLEGDKPETSKFLKQVFLKHVIRQRLNTARERTRRGIGS